jgi:hypothetical protein
MPFVPDTFVSSDTFVSHTGSRGGRIDWQAVTSREIHELSERMFDAAGVAMDTRQAYYSQLTQWLYTLSTPSRQ